MAKPTFKEQPLPREPKSDVKIITGRGTVLRERVRKSVGGGGTSLLITHARLGPNDEVLLDEGGNPLLGPVHEVVVGADPSTGVTKADIAAQVAAGREAAAAQAEAYFDGMAAVDEVLAGRFD